MNDEPLPPQAVMSLGPVNKDVFLELIFEDKPDADEMERFLVRFKGSVDSTARFLAVTTRVGGEDNR